MLPVIFGHGESMSELTISKIMVSNQSLGFGACLKRRLQPTEHPSGLGLNGRSWAKSTATWF
jgi:hypothetical protein